jgi:hypothetical protein
MTVSRSYPDTHGLLPCPFCGSNNIDPEGWASADRSGPACDDCSCSADTIERWNTRPSEADLRCLVATYANEATEAKAELRSGGVAQRCAECDCEKGGSECRWIKTAKGKPDRDAIYRAIESNVRSEPDVHFIDRRWMVGIDDAVDAILALPSTHSRTAASASYCALCDLEHQLHEDAQGFHHVVKGARVGCPSPGGREAIIGNTNWCGHGMMAALCPVCSLPSPARGDAT